MMPKFLGEKQIWLRNHQTHLYYGMCTQRICCTNVDLLKTCGPRRDRMKALVTHFHAWLVQGYLFREYRTLGLQSRLPVNHNVIDMKLVAKAVFSSPTANELFNLSIPLIKQQSIAMQIACLLYACLPFQRQVVGEWTCARTPVITLAKRREAGLPNPPIPRVTRLSVNAQTDGYPTTISEIAIRYVGDTALLYNRR